MRNALQTFQPIVFGSSPSFIYHSHYRSSHVCRACAYVVQEFVSHDNDHCLQMLSATNRAIVLLSRTERQIGFSACVTVIHAGRGNTGVPPRPRCALLSPSPFVHFKFSFKIAFGSFDIKSFVPAVRVFENNKVLLRESFKLSTCELLVLRGMLMFVLCEFLRIVLVDCYSTSWILFFMDIHGWAQVILWFCCTNVDILCLWNQGQHSASWPRSLLRGSTFSNFFALLL